MTEQATAQETNQAQNDAAANAQAAEAAQQYEQAELKRRREAEEREAFETRERIRKQRMDAGMVDSKFAGSAFATYMRSVVPGIDPNTVDFVTGVAGIKGYVQDQKQQGVAIITALDGTLFTHKVDDKGAQTFGVTHEQLKGQPLSTGTAAHMVEMCAAAGYTHIALTGSVQDKETMWLEARKRGLIVDNFVPRQEIQDQYDAYKASQITAGITGTAREQVDPAAETEQKQPGTSVQAVNTPNSRHVGDSNIVDAVWEPVKDEPATPATNSAGTKYLANPVLRLTDQSNRGNDDSGPKALPPPSR